MSVSSKDQFQPINAVTLGTANLVKGGEEDGGFALSTEEIGLVSTGLVTVPELVSMSDPELNLLHRVKDSMLKRRKVVAPQRP